MTRILDVELVNTKKFNTKYYFQDAFIFITAIKNIMKYEISTTVPYIIDFKCLDLEKIFFETIANILSEYGL